MAEAKRIFSNKSSFHIELKLTYQNSEGSIPNSDHGKYYFLTKCPKQ